MTLDKAVGLAREKNPDLQAARQELDIAQGRLVKARYLSPFNPELGGSAGRRNFGGVVGGSNDWDITLSQEVEIAGQRGKRIEEAEHNLARVQQQVKDTERLTLAQVKNAFYRSLYVKKRWQLFREVEDLNRRLRKIAALRFQAGDVPKIDVNVAEIRLGQSRKETIVAAREYHNALRELERLLGLDPVGETQPVGDLGIQAQTFEADRLLRLALETRPDLQAAALEQKRVEAEIALTRRLIVPNPTIRAFYSEEEAGDSIVGGAVTFPLPIFDHKQGELTQLTGRKSQARYEQQSITLRIQQEVRDALRSYASAKEEVEVFEQAVLEQAAENFQLMEIAYREGKIDLLQVVVVQNDLVDAQFSYVDSLWDYWLAHTAVERAVGQDL